MAVGVSEEHMVHAGTITAKPGSWLTVLFDAVESLVRHGIKRILILNGHGGNKAPLQWALRFWQDYFESVGAEVDVRFHTYWETSREEIGKHCKGDIPGHAQEYETALALALCPENVRKDAMQEQADKEPLNATTEQGHLLAETAVCGVMALIQDMMNSPKEG
jgi:creatinine amidohydrolase